MMINFSAKYDELLLQKKQLFQVIDQAYLILDQQYYPPDPDQKSQITLNQCLFVIDYVFSIYQIDKSQKQLVIEKIKLLTFSSCLIRSDFKMYLIHTCSGYNKRDHNITIEELLEYFSIKLILQIENYWIELRDQNILFITKEACIEFIHSVIQKYNINYSEVDQLVQDALQEIHMFVFFEDSISILLQIARKCHLKKKKNIQNKQKCSCQIF
ncbi:hypothetical protein ABPG74_014538 [Tetrahymena malaccensis]